MYKGYEIASIRILPSDKTTFPTEIDFYHFITDTMFKRGGYYYFPSSMMKCPNNSLVLFQYDGMIRAVGVLVDSRRQNVFDERGVEYAGYYEFDTSTLCYLSTPINKALLSNAYPAFKSFNQTKQIIPLSYLDDIISIWDKEAAQADIIVANITEEIDQLPISGTEKEAIVKIRVNQGIFRERLLHRYGRCCICGINHSELLIASHIKPWSVCDAVEKLDADNGLLLCPNHDKLFDGGWISFDEDGYIVISSKLSSMDKALLNFSDDIQIALTEKNKSYLRYHLEHIFRR